MSESYFIFSNGELKRKDNVVRITALDGRFKDIKVEMTRDIYLFGEVSLNTKCLNYLATLKIPVHVFNYYGFYTGTFYPKETNVSGKLFVKQVENYTDNSKRTEIAQLIIDAASSNILRNLRYYQERGKELEEIIEQIKALRKGIFKTQNIEELMALKNENYGKDFVKLNEKSLEAGNSANKINGLNEELKNISGIAKIKKIEKNGYFTVFFVEKKDKGEFIGKNGKNIRKLKKIFGDIVVKEM